MERDHLSLHAYLLRGTCDVFSKPVLYAIITIADVPILPDPVKPSRTAARASRGRILRAVFNLLFIFYSSFGVSSTVGSGSDAPVRVLVVAGISSSEAEVDWVK